MVLINIRPHIRPHKSCFSSVNLQNACVRAFFAPNTPLPFKRALARDRCNRLVNYGPPRAPATVIVTVIRLARPRATLSLNVIPRFPRVRTRLAFLSPLSGVGGCGAYIDRTVDKVSFVIFVMKSVASLSVDRQNHAR